MGAAKGRTSLILTASALILAVVIGCGGGPEVLPVPPAPPLASVIVTSSSTTTVAHPTTSETLFTTETTSPEPTTSAVEVPPQVTQNEATVSFPDKITFSITAKGQTDIQSISLKYVSDVRTLAPETKYTEAKFTPGRDVTTSWDWEMKKTGSLPPGATVRWTWELTDKTGLTTTTPEQSIAYDDTRFVWEMREYPDYDVYWHDQSETLIDELLSEVQSRLARVQLDVVIPPERKPKVFIYRSSDELKDAILFEQEWTGAIAYLSYNIILTAVNEDSLDWAKGTLPHEITHLLVGEAIFGPFGDIPVWLNEGLAMYSEGELADYLQESLDKGIRERTLISVHSLASGFPTDPAAAYLAYAESESIVAYLVEKYGWEDMRLLLAAFKEGSTNDEALIQVYSFDVAGLESQWKTHIGA
jgi:hypothetical protein